MALHTYTPTEWKNAPDHKTTPVNATNLNNIETGIENAYTDIGTVDTAVGTKANQAMIATVQSNLTAVKAYAVGEQFVYNGLLYKATAAISSGGTITINGNCTLADSVTEQIDKAQIILTTIPSSVATITNAITNIYNQLSALNIPELKPINYSVFWTGHDRYYGEAILYGTAAHLTLTGYNTMYICDVDNGTATYKTVSTT